MNSSSDLSNEDAAAAATALHLDGGGGGDGGDHGVIMSMKLFNRDCSSLRDCPRAIAQSLKRLLVRGTCYCWSPAKTAGGMSTRVLHRHSAPPPAPVHTPNKFAMRPAANAPVRVTCRSDARPRHPQFSGRQAVCGRAWPDARRRRARSRSSAKVRQRPVAGGTCAVRVFRIQRAPCIAASLATAPVPAAGATRPSAAGRRVVTPSQPHTADLRERIYLEQTIRRLLPEVLLMAATVICFMRVRCLCSASTTRPPWTRLRENTERHEK